MQNSNPIIQNSTNSQNVTITCKYCKNLGHTLEECRKRMYNNNLRRNSHAQGNEQIPARTGATPGNITSRLARVISEKSVSYRTISKYSLNRRCPSVKLKSSNFTEDLKFLIDSGSRPNIIKKNSVTSDTVMDKNEILRLSGITTHHVTTLGRTDRYLRMSSCFPSSRKRFSNSTKWDSGLDFFLNFTQWSIMNKINWSGTISAYLSKKKKKFLLFLLEQFHKCTLKLQIRS